MLWRRQEEDGPEAGMGTGNRDTMGNPDWRFQRAVPGSQGVGHPEALLHSD